MKININLGATSCPNRCRHCWIRGGDACRRELIPRAELWQLLDRFEKHKTVRFSLGLGDEETYYPHFLEFYERVSGAVNFDPCTALPTNGWGVARDPGAAQRMKDAGIEHLRFTLYGGPVSHDAWARRGGAFSDIMLAVDRARAAEMRVGWNILLHKGNLADVPELLAMTKRYGEKATPTAMEPTGRAAEIEHLALDLSDIEQLPEELKRGCCPTDLAGVTCYRCLAEPSFFLTPRLDVHFAVMFSGSLRRHAASKLGNLTHNSIVDIVARLGENRLYRELAALSVQELADRYGTDGDKRLSGCCLHRKWLLRHFEDCGTDTDVLAP